MASWEHHCIVHCAIKLDMKPENAVKVNLLLPGNREISKYDVNMLCCVNFCVSRPSFKMGKITSAVIVLTLLWKMFTVLEGSPFPEGMYHTTTMEQYPRLLEGRNYQVKKIPFGPINRTPLKDLMRLPCEEEKDMDVHYFNDYGRVAIKKRTYTEPHFTNGKYYANMNDYDKQCTCSILYKAEWEPGM